MNQQDNIQDELNGMNSHLPSGSMPNAVPEGYFDGLAASIMARIRAEKELSPLEEIAALSPLLAGISRSMPNAVPENYFQHRIEELPVLIRDDENTPVLMMVGKNMPYVVPSGYFANLPEQVLARLARPKARVIPMFQRKWMRVAAAAMVAGIITISGYVYFSQKNDQDKPIAQQLKNVSTKELDEFIRQADISPTSTETAQSGTEVQRMLRDVSDRELDNFLAQIPIDDEDLLVIN